MKLKQALKDKLPEDELGLLVRGYDVIGDIAITIIPPELSLYEKLIGDTILAINKNVKVVAKRDGIYDGEYRTIPLSIIAGENRMETMHKEFGLRYFLNPQQVYFSVRSGSERKRISDLVAKPEDILVMFSGVGPFPLMIAHHNKGCSIVGIELNKKAHDYAVKNLKENRLQSTVNFYHGDVETIIPQLGKMYDRVIMPLPTTARSYLPLAIAGLNKNGWLHYYDFKSTECFEESIAEITDVCTTQGRTLSHAEPVVCGHRSPEIYRVCIDAQII